MLNGRGERKGLEAGNRALEQAQAAHKQLQEQTREAAKHVHQLFKDLDERRAVWSCARYDAQDKRAKYDILLAKYPKAEDAAQHAAMQAKGAARVERVCGPTPASAAALVQLAAAVDAKLDPEAAQRLFSALFGGRAATRETTKSTTSVMAPSPFTFTLPPSTNSESPFIFGPMIDSAGFAVSSPASLGKGAGKGKKGKDEGPSGRGRRSQSDSPPRQGEKQEQR